MNRFHRTAAWALALVLTTESCCPSALQAWDVLQRIFHTQPPLTEPDACVETLAREIDWLEKHFDCYGSVVAKQPDVWGQARLTKHREEFEKVMAKQLNCFQTSVQGSISRNDSAFFANAFALSAAVGGGTSTVVTPAAPAAITASDAQSLLASPQTATPAPLPLTNFNNGTPGIPATSGIALEPTIVLDQQARYLDALHNLRRVNEGDDTSAAPGYGLYLIRLPVSLLPGKWTRRGYGGEITATATPILTETLLPTTFRNLVINDVVEQLGMPLTRIADLKQWRAAEKVAQLEAQLKTSLALVEQLQESMQTVEMNIKRETQTNEYTRANILPETARASNPAIAKVQALRNTQRDLKDKLDKAQNDNSRLQSARSTLQETQSALTAAAASAIASGPAQRSRQSRFAIPPTQVTAVFGSDDLVCVAESFFNAYKGPNVRWNDDPNRRVLLLDVERWLSDEIDAAYDMLSTPECESLWREFVPAVAAQIRAGFFSEVCKLRNDFYDRLNHQIVDPASGKCKPGGECDEQVVKSLTWAIIVEASMLHAQLLDDMERTARSQGGQCMATADLGMFLPNPPVEARQAFNQYVQLRWPIHIFALDPYTQEQNIADSLTQKRELQLAMSLGFLGGQISAQDLMQFSRSTQTDIQTIALNGTAIGFSHGNDTFGWRFYPRLQTMPSRGTLATVAQTLCGPHPDSDLLERTLEPGMRECVALIIMPSFVPSLKVETRSSWIRLNEHNGWLPTRHQREISTVDIVRLSRSVQSVHNLAMRICDSQAYRPGEVELLVNRVHQLDRQLPMQSMVIQVPIENTIGGFQLFNNGVTDLAPELRGWYGAPGIFVKAPADASKDGSGSNAAATGTAGVTMTCGNAGTFTTWTNGASSTTTPAPAASTPAPTTTPPATTKAPASSCTSACGTPDASVADCSAAGTTLFLVGNHFSIHDTRVIAGGICISGDNVSLMSKEIMRVTIPSTVNIVTIEKEQWVDIHVATPYGVTSHLHVPVIPTATPAPAAKSPTTPTAPAPTPTLAIPVPAPAPDQGAQNMSRIPAINASAPLSSLLPAPVPDPVSLPAITPATLAQAAPALAPALAQPILIQAASAVPAIQVAVPAPDASQKPWAGPRSEQPSHFEKLHNATKKFCQKLTPGQSSSSSK